jgi:uncharacterized pyridoxamine 5'-phosphate oxidase family protein
MHTVFEFTKANEVFTCRCNNKTKDMFKQLKQNPDIEISDMESNAT